jgi:apolipoprotein N-acyltransferase
MILPRLRPIALSCLSGVLYPLAFPDFDVGILAWVVLVPLHLAWNGATHRQAFWLGWLSGTIAFTGIMAWVVTAMTLYGKVPIAISYAVMLLLTSYLGLYVALYGLGVTWLRRTLPSVGLFCAPFLWVTLELIRTYFLTGLPWMLLGYSQYRLLPLIQIADHTGVYGVSFLLVLGNIVVTELVQWVLSQRPGARSLRFPWWEIAAALACLGVTLLYDAGQTVNLPVQDGARHLHIGVVQPNVDQAHKWDIAYRRETLDRFTRLTKQVAGEGIDLVIWPEAATPFVFERELEYREELTALAKTVDAPIVFGSPTLRYHDDRRPYLLNSGYLLSPDGQVLGRYDKQHLVPFGEYIPLKSSLLFFLDKLVEGIGDFEPGPGPTVLSFTPKGAESALGITGDPPPRRSTRFGLVICYEIIFPDLVRRFSAEGVDFMTTITNDAWFGRSSAPLQHFSMVVFRAVENRVAFARSANTGISGFVAPSGQILDTSPIFTEQVLSGTIPARRHATFYSRYGDVFSYACAIITALLCLAGYAIQTTGPTRGTPASLPT